MPSPSLTIGQLAQRTGANIETIRYYERIGLLPVALRQRRYRSYDTTDVARLGFVRRSRELGFAIKEVRALLDLAAGGTKVAPKPATSPPSICTTCDRVSLIFVGWSARWRRPFELAMREMTPDARLSTRWRVV